MQAKAVGRVLQALRLVANMTQADVCAQAQISINFLSQLENGRKEMSHAAAGRLATVLGVPVAFVYVLADAAHPAVQPLYAMVRQEVAQILARRVGERLQDFETVEELLCWRAWQTFDSEFPDNVETFIIRTTLTTSQI